MGSKTVVTCALTGVLTNQMTGVRGLDYRYGLAKMGMAFLPFYVGAVPCPFARLGNFSCLFLVTCKASMIFFLVSFGSMISSTT